tara:strand:- start:124 stop:1620 length:1497 start_codon:yes stop_codon:yes gene_type:complete
MNLDLLVIAPSAAKLYQALNVEHTAIETNIWVGLLANSVRNEHSVAIYDLEVERPTNEEFYNKVKDYNPKLVLFVATGQNPNASTAAMDGATRSSSILGSEFKIAFVGPHVNALPVETLEKHPEIDIALTNEGVYALKNLLKTDLKDISHVNGIAYRDESGCINLNPPERIVPQNLLEQELPGIAYDLMPTLDKYRTSHWHANYQDDRSPFASIYTSLGCSFKCNFCMINIINRTENGSDKYAGMFNKFRYWSPEFTIKQLDYLADKGVKHVKIADELFLNNPNKHAMPLCDLIIDRGYKFNIWAYTRVNTVREHHLDKLKKAGVNWLAIGIENVRQNVRQEIEKGVFKDSDIGTVVKMIEGAGIHVIQNYIVGLPGESVDDARANLEFALDLKCAAYNVYPSMALPGSQLYTDALANNRVLPKQYSEFGFLSYDCLPLDNGIMSHEEILKIRDENWMLYHRDEQFLLETLKRFGKTAVDNIRDMTSVNIKRKLLDIK